MFRKIWQSGRWVLIGAMACLLLAGCSGEEDLVQRNSFNVGGSPLLVMNLDDGDITISPSGNAGEIRITATINDPSKANYETSQDGDTVSVSTSHTGNIRINTGADVEVAVPERTRLEVRTDDGDITVIASLEPGFLNLLDTHDGDVEVTLVDTPGVQLDALSRGGKVTTSLPLTRTGRSEDDELVGEIGDGSSSLIVRTTDGDITIR